MAGPKRRSRLPNIMDDFNRQALLGTLHSLRKQLERAFRPDTAAQGFRGSTPSTGHCAAVAVIVYELLGGVLVSTLIEGHSHWLNRLPLGGRALDVDLTGDQFGRPPVQIGDCGQLYPDVRVRKPDELTDETLLRARLVAERSSISEVVRAIDAALTRRAGTVREDSIQGYTPRSGSRA
jgi:hypothetical protein